MILVAGITASVLIQTMNSLVEGENWEYHTLVQRGENLIPIGLEERDFTRDGINFDPGSVFAELRNNCDSPVMIMVWILEQVKKAAISAQELNREIIAQALIHND